jgi:CRP-like cAMP-binding protein
VTLKSEAIVCQLRRLREPLTWSTALARKAHAGMNDQLAALMTGFPLLQGFTAQGTQRLLERGEVRACSTGEILFKEGDPPAFVVLVLDGNIQVIVERDGDDMVLTDAGPGTVLGELSVLCGAARAASVPAKRRRSCNGTRRLFAICSCVIRCCRIGFSKNRCARWSRKNGC